MVLCLVDQKIFSIVRICGKSAREKSKHILFWVVKTAKISITSQRPHTTH